MPAAAMASIQSGANTYQVVGKLLKPAGETISAFEKQVGNLLLEVQSASEVRAAMEELFITKAQVCDDLQCGIRL